MPITVPLLMPFERTEPCPRVGSAVADGVMMMVLTWPVTVVTLVIASVATVDELGDGDEGEVLGLGVGEGLELGGGLGEGDVTSVLDGACVICVSTILLEAFALEPCFRRDDAVKGMDNPYSGGAGSS